MKITSSIRAHPETEDDDMQQLYDVSIFDETILTTATAHPDVATQWIDALSSVDENTGIRYIGFEIEFDDNTSRIATLQLCVGMQCLVFQLPATPLAPSLDQFLGDEKNVFVGINVVFKMEQLKNQCSFEALPQCQDLDEPLAQQRESLQGTLALTVETDWDRPMKLSHKQVLYACVDAFLILHLLDE